MNSHALNGEVKKVTGTASIRLVHILLMCYKQEHIIDPHKLSEEEEEEVEKSFESCCKYNSEIRSYMDKAAVMDCSYSDVQEDLTAQVVLDLFKRIPSEDLPLIWINEVSGRPENLILTDIMVPPVTIRPSVQMESTGGSNEDDITMILQDIVRSNAQLQNSVGNGANMRIVMDNWDHLQILCAELINGDLPGMSTLVKSAIPKRALVQRLKGKVFWAYSHQSRSQSFC